MQYKEIVSVTGLSGLYQLVTTKSDGAIVRNIDDKAIKFISARQHHVTPIDSIEVYTIGDNVHLHEVFAKMLELEEQFPLVDTKTADNKAIKGYFKDVFPEFDEDRVYVSDMKKMLKWFVLLKNNDLLNFEKVEDAKIEDDEDNEEIPYSQPENAGSDDAKTDLPNAQTNVVAVESAVDATSPTETAKAETSATETAPE